MGVNHAGMERGATQATLTGAALPLVQSCLVNTGGTGQAEMERDSGRTQDGRTHPATRTPI